VGGRVFRQERIVSSLKLSNINRSEAAKTFSGKTRKWKIDGKRR
jgi:hypothetical protein